MKNFLVTYCGEKDADERSHPASMDRAFDTAQEAEDFLISQGYDTRYRYQIWERKFDIQLTKHIEAIKLPPTRK
jgi:hypothetical protein